MLKFGLLAVGMTACALIPIGSSLRSSPAPQTEAEAPVPPAPPAPPKAEFAKSEQDLDDQLALATKGFTPAGPALHRSLAAFEPVNLTFARDRYYTIIVKLDPGAAFSKDAQATGLSFLIEHDRDSFVRYPGVIGPGGFIGGDNVPTRKLTSNYSKPMDVAFEIQLDGLSQDRYQHPAQLGTGGATVQVLSRRITKADEHADTQAEEVRVQAWNDERTEMKTKMCDRCEQDYNMCRVSADGSNCVRKYKYCAKPARDRDQPSWQWCGRTAP
jgi:hypothetical protein